MRSPLPPHDCSKVMQKVHLALDGEMTTPEMEAFLADIERCSHCLEQYRIEESFKRFLVDRIGKRRMSESARQTVRRRLAAAMGAPGLR